MGLRAESRSCNFSGLVSDEYSNNSQLIERILGCAHHCGQHIMSVWSSW